MQPLGRILALLDLRGPGPLKSRQIHGVLSEVLGEDETRSVRIGSLRRRCLVLEVPSAAHAFEWQAFRRDEVLARLKTEPGLEHLDEVRVRVGTWRDHGRRQHGKR